MSDVLKATLSRERLEELRKIHAAFQEAGGTIEDAATLEDWGDEFRNGTAIEELFTELDRLRLENTHYRMLEASRGN